MKIDTCVWGGDDCGVCVGGLDGVVGGVEETVEKVEVEELDVNMLQMTEMLASLMTRPAMKQEIETKLRTAFNILVKEAYPESGKFFLSKKEND